MTFQVLEGNGIGYELLRVGGRVHLPEDGRELLPVSIRRQYEPDFRVELLVLPVVLLELRLALLRGLFYLHRYRGRIVPDVGIGNHLRETNSAFLVIILLAFWNSLDNSLLTS